MSMSTNDLTNELSKREGVRTVTIKPHEEIKITTDQETIELSGPAIILINQD